MDKISSLLPYASHRENDTTGVRSAFKRMLDICIAGLMIIALSPLMLLIMLLIKLDSSGPVLFRRRLLGYLGHEFDMFKFRTMYQDSDDLVVSQGPYQEEFSKIHKLKNDPRITRLGRILRKHSLDELPQLLNVLKGDMSLVGPRPIHADELEQYNGQVNLFHLVKPGMTGLWQVSGRSNLEYEERVRLDIYYVRHWSIQYDLRLLIRTIPIVIRGLGAY
jgi:lipopolysaccharide/colanic/teichoic acid biosynthesis glycosyltransferase